MPDIVVEHGCAGICEGSSLVPNIVVVTGIKELTHDVKLFTFKTPGKEMRLSLANPGNSACSPCPHLANACFASPRGETTMLRWP